LVHFFNRESFRRELVRGVWGAKGIDNKGLGREIREKAKGLLWVYKKH